MVSSVGLGWWLLEWWWVGARFGDDLGFPSVGLELWLLLELWWAALHLGDDLGVSLVGPVRLLVLEIGFLYWEARLRRL